MRVLRNFVTSRGFANVCLRVMQGQQVERDGENSLRLKKKIPRFLESN